MKNYLKTAALRKSFNSSCQCIDKLLTGNAVAELA